MDCAIRDCGRPATGLIDIQPFERAPLCDHHARPFVPGRLPFSIGYIAHPEDNRTLYETVTEPYLDSNAF